MDFRRFIIAGSETSGAVVHALNMKALRVGPEIDRACLGPQASETTGPSLSR